MGKHCWRASILLEASGLPAEGSRWWPYDKTRVRDTKIPPVYTSIQAYKHTWARGVGVGLTHVWQERYSISRLVTRTVQLLLVLCVGGVCVCKRVLCFAALFDDHGTIALSSNACVQQRHIKRTKSLTYFLKYQILEYKKIRESFPISTFFQVPGTK